MLADFESLPQAAAFRTVILQARYLGYIPGLTYQSLPFDFRVSFKANVFRKIFKPNLIRLNRLSSKKVMIVVHSYGNIGVSVELNKMSQKFKDDVIFGWISITPPQAGSIRAINVITGGYRGFMYFWNMGLGYSSGVKICRSFSSIYEMLPQSGFIQNNSNNNNETWMSWVDKRYSICY